MTTLPLAPSGGPVDCCWHQGVIYVVWQDGPGPNARLVLRGYRREGVVLSSVTFDVGSDVGAFPRLLSAHGSLWLLYREGKSLGGQAVLRKDGVVAWRSDVECGGNDPVCLAIDGVGAGVFAWQQFGTNAIRSARVLFPTSQLPEGFGRGTGLSHLSAAGVWVLVDDARGAIVGMTRPSFAGALAAGEHPDSGVLVRHADGRVLRVWAGQAGATPRLAHDAQTGAYAVATWGELNRVNAGVRLAIFTEADLALPVVEPTIAPWPPGVGWTQRTDITEIDIVEWFLGSQDWSRNGMHVAGDAVTYSHPFQSHWQRSLEYPLDEGWVQHTKFGPPDSRAATWTFTDTWVGLAFDGTNELSKGYRFVNPGTDKTAAIYPRRMVVGEQHRRVVELDILDLATGDRRRVTWAGWVARCWENTAPIGDIPAGTVHAEIMFEPAFSDTRGWRERNICAPGWGAWYWDQHRKAAGSLPDMRWIGTKHAPRFPDIPVQFSTHVPVARDTDQPHPNPTPHPQPEPEPMPIPEPTITDPEAANAWGRVEHHYDRYATQLGYSSRYVHTNPLSGIWMIRYYQARQRGQGHEAAIQAVERAMAKAAGVGSDPAEPEPPPVDPGVPPPTTPRRLRGALRISAGTHYADDNGPCLPIACHAGDLLSRWTREPGAVEALLDQVAAAGYDGVRTWTVLHGTYWRGREVGPMHQGEGYWQAVAQFRDALRARGLRWLVSQGDMLRAIPSQADRRAFMTRLAGLFVPEDLLGVDAGNEAWNDNGEDDAGRMREVVDAFRAVCACEVWSLTSPAGEEKHALDPYAGSVYDVHGYRGGRAWDKVRHIFSLFWEVKPAKKVGIQSEGFGFGDRVSASDNKSELTSGVMGLACGVSLLARQMWVFFSGPGVISDEGQRLVDMPGFAFTPTVRDFLPVDLMTFGTVCHGGASQRGTRVWAVPGTDETRVEQAIHADGRTVGLGYGPKWRDVTEERGVTIDATLECGSDGVIWKGRLR